MGSMHHHMVSAVGGGGVQSATSTGPTAAVMNEETPQEKAEREAAKKQYEARKAALKTKREAKKQRLIAEKEVSSVTDCMEDCQLSYTRASRRNSNGNEITCWIACGNKAMRWKKNPENVFSSNRSVVPRIPPRI